jgi:hypothetical protein
MGASSGVSIAGNILKGFDILVDTSETNIFDHPVFDLCCF